MIDAQLPSPGVIPTSAKLRQLMARTISYIEVVGSMQGGKLSQAKELDTFLVASRAAIASFIDSVLPTFVSALLDRSDNPRLLTVTFSEPLDPTSVPATTAFASSLGGAVTKVEIAGTQVRLTLTSDVAAGALTIAYTKPGSGAVLKDTSGNEVATFAAQTATNQA